VITFPLPGRSTRDCLQLVSVVGGNKRTETPVHTLTRGTPNHQPTRFRMITTTTTISSSTATRAGSGTGSIVDESPRVDDIPSMTATTDHRNPLRPATQEQSICTTDSDLPSNEETSTIRVTDVLCGRGKVDHGTFVLNILL
jgi:hypothetical protein